MDPGDVEVLSLKLADNPHAAHNEHDDKEEGHVGDQAVDAQHDKQHCVVAREVSKVVVHPGLYLREVYWLGQSLDIEKLGDGSQVGEPGGQRLGAYAGEPL